MKVPLCAILMVATSLPGKAQDTLPKHFVACYWEPLSLLDIKNGSSFRAGATYDWSRRWSVYGTGGVYTWQGYMVRGGLRFALKETSTERYNIALDFMHAWHTRIEKDFIAIPDSNNSQGYDKGLPVRYGVEKNVNVISLLYYYEVDFAGPIYCQVYFGGGIKFRNSIISISQNGQDSLYDVEVLQDPSVRVFSDARGRGIFPNITGGITLGYLFPLQKKSRGA